ncbi:LysR family transcriptional regulator [Bordetella sp. BOR01]|uniref:LysR family transcriptional regulator n=1 Tax=Bordetella sp. BOR01 TaxID=2854779 RepID=UPI001C46F196|nr:LysR family transcriptional regulator [Bordetella sp. BOR01]MBV7483181.1 LysR family transcriptional regulator [Bordetella sp. BOR01]
MSYYPSYTALKCLEVSARLLSLTRAGRELHLTQGAVSHHISKLEEQLGVALFERHAGGLALTAAGTWFVQQMTPAIRRIEQATDGLRSGAHRQELVRISVQPTFADYWLMPKLNRFSLDHPEICLDIVVRSGDADSNDAVDAWFEQSTGAAPGIDALKILDLIYKPYVSPGRLAALGYARMLPAMAPESLVDILRRSPLLKTTATQVWENWLRQKGIISQIDPEHLGDGPRYAMVSLVLRAVMDGVGVALLPGYLTAAPLSQGELLCLDEEGWQSDRPYHMRWASGSRARGLATLIDWMEREMAGGAP